MRRPKFRTLAVRRLSRALARFTSARGGNVAVTFAFSVIPVLAFVGASVDYSRANAIKNAMQAALDSTALLLSRDAATLSSTDLQTKASDYFAMNFARAEVGNIRITATYTSAGGSTVVVGGSADMPTQFMSMLGYNAITVTGNSTAAWGSTRLRVALVLDTTGSMDADGKLTALKTATRSLLTQLQAAATNNGDVHVSIVPFSRGVNVGAGNYSAPWIDWSEWEAPPAYMSTWLANGSNLATWEQTGPGAACPFSNSQTGFTCTRSPATGASSTSTVPSSGSYSGYICPGADSGSKDGSKAGFHYNGCYTSTPATRIIASGWNASCGTAVNCTCGGSGGGRTCTQSYFSHAWVANARSTWTGCVADRGSATPPGTSAGNDQTAAAPAANDATTLYPARQDTYCPPAAMGLSYNWTAMNSLVTNLFANGGTNQPIGLVNGWHSLAGIGPYGAPPKEAGYTYNEVIILLSDGLNTWDRWYGNGSSTSTAVDYRMLDPSGRGTCANIKAANITIYTIQVNTGGDATSTLLRNCASSADKFFLLTSAGQIVTAFNQIGTNLSRLRVAR